MEKHKQLLDKEYEQLLTQFSKVTIFTLINDTIIQIILFAGMFLALLLLFNIRHLVHIVVLSKLASPVEPSTAQYCPVQPNTAQYSPLQPKIAQYSPKKLRTVL